MRRPSRDGACPNSLLTGTVMTRTVPVNNFFLTGILLVDNPLLTGVLASVTDGPINLPLKSCQNPTSNR